MLTDIFMYSPAVFVVGNDYQIMVPVKEHCLMGVSVNGNEYYDESNGVLRSATDIHRITVPMSELDSAKEYTVFFYRVFERNPYRPKVGEKESVTFKFKPLPTDNIHIYHLADAHSKAEPCIKAAKYFGDNLDLLILNGDMHECSDKIENFYLLYEIISEVTHGEIPVVFARGNHDMRGEFAEKLEDYTPTDNGKCYYTFRLGSIWGVILDAGEDKDDDNIEYSNTVRCHTFRQRQTEFLKNLDEKEYNAEGVKYKIVVSHNPFSEKIWPPFDIEGEIFTDWCKILGETVKPDFFICGHMHKCYVSMPGSERDSYGQPCPVIVASNNKGERPDFYEAGALTLSGRTVKVEFTDELHNVIESQKLNI